MGKNYLETLCEQLKDPEFRAEWDALHAGGDVVEIQIDAQLLEQLKEIITPMGFTPELLIQMFFSWCVNPDTREEAIAWLRLAKETQNERE